MSAAYDVVVLGSGIQELVTAALLARGRARVLVLEPRAEAGGLAAAQTIAPGFRAPVVAGEEGWLSPRLVRTLGLDVSLTELEPSWLVAPASNGAPLLLGADRARTLASVGARSPQDAERWDHFTASMEALSGFLGSLYEAAPPDPFGSGLTSLAALSRHALRLRGMGKGRMMELLRTLPMSALDLLDAWFEDDLLKAALGATAVTNLFQGPRSGGTSFVLLHHLVGRPRGAFAARRRRAGLLDALLGVVRGLGVEVRTGAGEVRVHVEESRGLLRATGVETGSETIAARAVASGSDPRRAFLRELGGAHLDPHVARAAGHVKLRGARSVVHLALSGLPAFTDVSAEALRGTVVLGSTLEDLERAFDQAKHGAPSTRPSCTLALPSLADAGLAPTGQHVMTVYVQYTPYRRRDGRSWDVPAREDLARRVVGRIEEHAPGFAQLVVGQRVYTPADLESELGRTEGHLEQGELTLDQILFMRPLPGWSRYATPVPGFFLCGDAVHPGGGLPGLGGSLAAREIDRYINA